MGVIAVPLRIFFGLRRPKRRRVLGQEMAGDVIEVGDEVDSFAVGDRVAAHGAFRFGGYAERASVPVSNLVARIPDGVGYEEAVPIPTAGVYGLRFVESADLQSGHRVLVIGAAGAIGSFTTQIAKQVGAHVTGVDHSAKRGHVLDMGSDEFIGYDEEDFTVRRGEFDRILDVVDKSSFGSAAAALSPGGVYLHTDMSPVAALRRKFSSTGEGKVARFVPGEGDPTELERLLAMVADGSLRVPIDRAFPLDEIVAAHRYAESGEKTGNIVVRVS